MMEFRYRYLIGLFIVLLAIAPQRSMAQYVLTLDGHTGNYLKNDCSPLQVSANATITTVVFNEAVWQLNLDGGNIFKQVDPFFGFFTSLIDLNTTVPARDGTYNLTYNSAFDNVNYQPVTVTLARRNPNPCPLGKLDGNYCLFESVPAGGFIFDNKFYVLPTRSKDCAIGTFDGANCLILPVPPNGFIYHNAFYVTPTAGSCPQTVGPYSTHFDNVNCYLFGAPLGTLAFEYTPPGQAPNWYTQTLPECPKGTTFDTVNCLVKAAPPGTTAVEFNGNWYVTPPQWCLP